MQAAPLSLFLVLLVPVVLPAEEHWYNYDHLYFQAGSYIHFHPNEDHHGSRVFTSLEAVRSDDWLYGLALFNNSFNQFSQYLYGGKNWYFGDDGEGLHAKVTVGLIHGYKGEYQDKIQYNGLGVAPALIPGIGYKKSRYGADVYVLGDAGLLFTAGMDF